ncbi:MAG: crosslink repair DNA glycosylase YcaQ family protein [Acidobacteriota bacterium]
MSAPIQTLDQRRARRLALARAGLLNPEWTGMPKSGRRLARSAALRVVDRFGYLQLDTVSIAGARSHCLVLLSRLAGLDPTLGESLLAPGTPLFEYWGHEASWIPWDLYPAFEWRRREFQSHPWWGDLLRQHRPVADGLLRRIETEGPLRSKDFDGQGGQGWWNLKIAVKVAAALWSAGHLAIRERRSFQRVFDLTERVIPAELRDQPWERPRALRHLLRRALAGHGWATTGTLAATWRLRNLRQPIATALGELQEAGEIVPCRLNDGATPGWIRVRDLELAERLARVRPRRDRGVLLSPFDPVLWDRGRVQRLFDFEQLLEIFKPAPQRRFGYYCLPVLAGERLIGRVDLKAEMRQGRLMVLSCHFEAERPSPADRAAMDSALVGYAEALRLTLGSRLGPSPPSSQSLTKR